MQNISQPEKVTTEEDIKTEGSGMNNESDFKKVFCSSVGKFGGYSFKIAMSTMSGLPDIYCAMPGYVPVLLEAKYDKSITEGKFKRKIKYRPFQREILNNCNKVYKYYTNYKVSFCLMGLDINDKKYCTLIDPELKEITHDLIVNENELVPIQKHKDGWFIDVDMLFCNCNVPLIERRADWL